MLTKKDYKEIIRLDKEIYPKNDDSPELLEKLLKKHPEFGIKIDQLGYFIVIPLNEKGWNKIIEGIEESELKKDELFDNIKDKKLGIHIYHVQKFTNKKNMTKLFFKELNLIIKKLIVENSELKVIGISGIFVQKYVIELFKTKYFFKTYKKINNNPMLILDPEQKSLIWEYLNNNYLLEI
jgi:hypothetical protein